MTSTAPDRSAGLTPASAPPYDGVVFAGGGNRCVWQAGFYRTVAEALPLAPARAAAASAGAAVAAVLFAGCFDAALAHFKRATSANRRNVHWANLFNGAPVFPHAEMYRRVLLEVVDDRALAKLRAGPELRVPITRLPRWLGARSGFAVAAVADACEHVVGPRVHPRLARWLGFRADYPTVRECGTPEALADLVLASSCTPPFTPLLRHGGESALDGGIVDNVPVDAWGEAPGRTLVLLTRRYRRLPVHPARTYVQPSMPVPVSSWDYTNPAGLQAGYDLGRRDGETFVRWSIASLQAAGPA
ncbi:MAG TPA: patatin-like phospholipase family protein [Casimicrobiaceae bacterium]|nr:patatin-like phospholipase family protein [Casimicrobiaceae bacterium]